MATPVDECTDAAIDSVLVSFLKEEQREMLGGQELFSFVAVIGQNKSLVGVANQSNILYGMSSLS